MFELLGGAVMAALEPKTSWPVPRHNDFSAAHNELDEWCVCCACSERRAVSIRATAERLLRELSYSPSNDVEPEPFSWDEPMPLGETELSGGEPGYRTLPGKRLARR